MAIREALRERARVWLIENNHHACDALARGIPKEDDVAYLAGMLADVRKEALGDAAKLVATTNYYEPVETTARRIRTYDGVSDPSPPLRPREG